MHALRRNRHPRIAAGVALVASLLLSACGPGRIPEGIEDPYEERNRRMHTAQLAIDSTVIRPVSIAYGRTVPRPVRTGVGNAAANLSLPGAMVNSLLQGRPGDAAQNLTRFLVNSTIGVAGIFDPATPMGAPEIDTDFGETLHVWGVAEGNYTVLPFLGPSTGRDTLGLVVDTAMNPLRHLPREGQRNAATGGRVLLGLGTRFDRSDTIDSILYDSADSYAQLRQVYLENRRFKLRRGAAPEYFDPYEDPYADASSE